MTFQPTSRRYAARAFIAWMISTSPSSHSRTTISRRRPAVSSPILSSRCGFSSSSGPPAKAEHAAAMASSSLIPCLRADGETITHGPTHAQRHESPLSDRSLHGLHVPSTRSALHQRTESAPPETLCPHEGDAPTAAATHQRRSPLLPHPPRPAPAHPRSRGLESSAYSQQAVYYVIHKEASCPPQTGSTHPTARRPPPRGRRPLPRIRQYCEGLAIRGRRRTRKVMIACLGK